MLITKMAIPGVPTRIVGNKAIVRNGDIIDVYNIDYYRCEVPTHEADDRNSADDKSRAGHGGVVLDGCETGSA